MSENHKKYVIIDTDCGVDDAWALMLAFDCHQKGLIELLAISCVYGNICVDKVVRNVLLTQRVCGIKNVKVFKGCENPIKGSKGFEDGFMGSDGLGDSTHSMPPIDVVIDAEHAVNALIRLANRYPGQITLIALGPLTNIAMASRIHPPFLNKLSQLISMGGLFEMVGNVGPTTEFNYINDPESVHMVLNNSRCPITIVPWDTCYRQRMSWKLFDRLISSGEERAQFIAKISYKQSVDEFYGRTAVDWFILCDIVAVITALFPQIVSISEEHAVVMEIYGRYTRGQLVVDRRPRVKGFPGSHSSRFVRGMDLNKAIELIQAMVHQN